MKFNKLAASLCSAAMLFSQIAPAAAATDDEILHLTFDNEDVQDSSSKGNHGTAHNIVYERGVSGKAARIINANGSTTEKVSSYIDLPDTLAFGTDDLTFSFWYKTDTGTEGGGAVIGNKDYDSGANDGFVIGNFSKNIRANFAFNRSRKDSTFGNVDGIWHHLAVVLDRDGSMTTYEDGVQKGSVDISALKDNSLDTNTWRIGADGVGTYGVIDGMIDEVQIFRSAKSKDEINQLYRTVKDQMESEDLTGTTVLKASFEQDAQDTSGRDNHGTIIGNPEFVRGISGNAIRIVNSNGSTSETAEQYVDFGNASDLKFGSDDFTLRFWVRSDNGVSGGGAVVSNKDYDSGGNTGFAIGNFNNGFRANFAAKGNSRKDLYGIAPIDGAWHYMVIEFDRDGKMTAYVDGESKGSTDISGSAGATIDAGHFCVGADGYGAYGLNDAAVDEVEVIRGVTAHDQDKTVFAESLLSYGLNAAPELIAQASVYVPEETATIEAAQTALEAAQNLGENAAVADKISAARTLESAVAALEALMPDVDPTLMLSVSFDQENAADESGRGNNGTVTGNVQYEDGISGKAIRIANANPVSANPADQYVAFEDTEDLRFGAEDFSFSLWYKENQDNREGSIFGNKDWDSGKNPGFNLGYVGRGLQMNFTANGASRKDVDPGHINDGKWHHLAVNADRDGLLGVYIDGELAKTVDISSVSGKSIDVYQLVLGADSTMRYGLRDGSIDELKVWKRLLSSEEIEKQADAGTLAARIMEAKELLNSDAPQTRKDALTKSIDAIQEEARNGGSLARLNANLSLALEAFEETREEPVLTFSVLSDVHIDSSESAGQNTNLVDALTDLGYLAPGSAATLFPGDLTNGGGESQYDAFYSILDQYSAAWPIPALGNHDVRWLCSSSDRNEAGLRIPTCVEGASPFAKRYLDRNKKYMGDTPEGQLYYDQWISGYHFITLNTEKDLKDQAYLSDEQIAWLAEILEGSEPDKPIFLQIHQTFQGTADHEDLDWIGGESEEKLKAVLENYPQAVIFTGHVHNGKDIIAVHNRTYGHVVDCPCFYYSSYGDKQNRIGYQVNVYEDDIEIRLRDFANDTWLDDYEAHVDLDAVDILDDSHDIDPSETTIEAGSEHRTSGSEGPASNLLDGNTSTIWHTDYSKGTTMAERWLEVSLKEETWVSGIRYLPRQTGSNGTILKAKVLTSDDNGATWKEAGQAVWKGYAGWKSLSFEPVKANKIRIEPIQTIGEYGSGAELRIMKADLSARSQLESAVKTASALDAADYTEESFAVLSAALTAAQTLLADENSSDADLLAAAADLESAMEGLEKVSTIRIASYNIAAGKKPDLQAINSQMDNLGIDIAGLQEIDVNNSRNNFDMLERIASYKTYPYTMFQKAIDFNGGYYGIGVVSSMPIEETSGASYEAAIGENRVWQRTLVEKDGKQIALYNTHLSYENTEIRKAQMLELIEAVKADPAEYKAITGDFNADQFHEEFYPFLEEGFNLSNGYDGTWHDTYNGVDDTMKVYSIDNIITTRNLTLTAMQVVENKLSDHNMLWAEFRFEDEIQPSRQMLQFVYQDACTVENTGYTQASWSRFEAARNAAADTEGRTQEEIDAIQAELEAAREGLTVLRDTTLLDMAIAYAQSVTEDELSNVNSIVKANFDKCLAAAIAVRNDAESSQNEINKAWQELARAIHMLEFRSDKAALNALIERAESLNESDFDPEDWAALQEALRAAKDVAASDTALTETIDAAAAALEEAINALQPAGLDLSLLEWLVEATGSEDLSKYVEDDALAAFTAALAQGRTVLADPQTQSQVDEAALSLNDAWLSLRLRPDESLLALLRDFVAQTESLDPSLYTEAEWQSIQSLREEIQISLADPQLDQPTAEALGKRVVDMKDLLSRKPAADTKVTNTDASISTGKKASSVKTASASHALAWMSGTIAAALGVSVLRRRRRK